MRLSGPVLSRIRVCAALGVLAAVLLCATSAMGAPAISLTLPAAMSTVTSTPVPVFSATVADVAVPVTGVFIVDGAPYPAVADATGSVFTYTPSFGSYWPSVPDTSLKDGSHEVTFTATNSLGESASQSWRFIEDFDPWFRDFRPAEGSWSKNQQPIVGSAIYDNGPLNWEVTVDGNHVSGSPGYAASTSYNYTNPLGGSPLGVLENGVHTATVTVTDAAGDRFTRTWSFEISNTDTSIAITSDLLPNQLFTNARPQPHFTVTSSATLQGIGVSVDGANQYTSTAVYSNGNMTLDATMTPIADFSDGKHSLVVSTSNSSYAQAYKQYDFVVQVPPTVFHLRPAPEVVSTDTAPTLVVRATDNSDVIPAITFKVDGTTVPTTSRRRIRPNRFEGTAKVTAALSTNETHTAEATVVDAGGNVVTKTWQFKIDAGTRMAHYDASATCWDCHPNIVWQTHSERIVYEKSYPCNGCHTTFGSHTSYGPAVIDDPATYLTGCSCHDPAKQTPYAKAHNAWIYPSACRSCHTSVNKLNDQADMANARGVTQPLLSETPRHDATGDMSLCSKCHKTELTFEHATRHDASGTTMTCQSCHASADPLVQAAIAAGDTSCQACHGTVQHAIAPTTEMATASCSSCHSVASHHMTTCTACHKTPSYMAGNWGAEFEYGMSSLQSPKPGTPLGACSQYYCHAMGQGDTHGTDRISSIVARGWKCETCHSASYASIPRHTVDKHSTTLDTECAGCHSAKLTVEHNRPGITCATCHGTTARAAAKAAVTANDTRCVACHDPATRHQNIK